MNIQKKLDELKTYDFDEHDGVWECPEGCGEYVKASDIEALRDSLTGYVLVKESEFNYLNEHHELTETAIGLAKFKLSRNNHSEALEWLNKTCKQIDKIIIKHHHEEARITGLSEEMSDQKFLAFIRELLIKNGESQDSPNMRRLLSIAFNTDPKKITNHGGGQ